MDTSALIAKLHIAQMQAQQLSVGAPATITVPGIDDPVPAKVSLISPALDPGSTTVEVWLRVENPKGDAQGRHARPRLHHRTHRPRTPSPFPPRPSRPAPTAPAKSVMVIAADGTAHKKAVTLGIQNAEDVQVLTGVTAADMVITTGAYGLDEGTKVKIGTDPNAKPTTTTRPDRRRQGACEPGKDADDK